MNKIGFIVDSTCAISKQYCDENNIGFAPLELIVDGQSYLDGIEMSSKVFMQQLRDGKIATTSQVTPGRFVEAYEAMIEKGYTTLFVLTISSQLSGTCQSAQTAIELLDRNDIQIIVIDTQIATAAATLQLLEAMEANERGADIETIQNILDHGSQSQQLIFALESVDYLQRSGRLSKASAFAAQFLQVKPILSFIDGEIVVTDKIRTLKKAITHVIGQIPTGVNRLMLIHPDDQELAKMMREALQVKFP
ncbi:MAG: DegV family protein, partial [Culicoidibacterales bacterium]